MPQIILSKTAQHFSWLSLHKDYLATLIRLHKFKCIKLRLVVKLSRETLHFFLTSRENKVHKLGIQQIMTVNFKQT